MKLYEPRSVRTREFIAHRECEKTIWMNLGEGSEDDWTDVGTCDFAGEVDVTIESELEWWECPKCGCTTEKWV